MLLFRPVGLEELRLVYLDEMRGFPPRLPDQPIFYPVTNEGYAEAIAREWNTTSGTFGGFVTRFSVDDDYAARFERRVVGAREHEELWVPAEELETFNSHIEGGIVVTSAHFGAAYVGEAIAIPTPGSTDLALADVRHALLLLSELSEVELSSVLEKSSFAVFSGALFWAENSFVNEGMTDMARDLVLARIAALWPHATSLGLAGPSVVGRV